MSTLIGLLMLGFSLLTASATANSAPRDSSAYWPEWKIELYQEHKEHQRTVLQWMRQKARSNTEQIQKTFELVKQGNDKDVITNERYASNFFTRSQELAAAGKTEAAENFARLSSVFTNLTECNRMISAAITNGINSELRNQISRYVELEQELFEMTKRPLRRSWITPDELRKGPPVPTTTAPWQNRGTSERRP